MGFVEFKKEKKIERVLAKIKQLDTEINDTDLAIRKTQQQIEKVGECGEHFGILNERLDILKNYLLPSQVSRIVKCYKEYAKLTGKSFDEAIDELASQSEVQIEF